MKKFDVKGEIMKNKVKILCFLTLVSGLLFVNTNYNIVNSVATTVKNQVNTVYTTVEPLKVVETPDAYLNKNITFDAEYVSFSSLGLDYKPALKESTKYIGILIKRNDVKDHTVPLSEMKIFLKRELAEKHTDLEEGDKIKISGIVFSTALGDPWVEARELNVIEKKKK